MTRLTIIALCAVSASVAIAQTNPKDVLKQVTDYQMQAYKDAAKSHDAGVYKAIADHARDMVKKAIKGVDPKKIDPKDAYDWARVYEIIGENKTVCDLTHSYLTTNPDADQQFKAKMLMMNACNSLGEADMLEQELSGTQPTNSNETIELAYSALGFVDTIANKKGSDEGLKVLDQVQGQIQLPDPKKAAQDRLDAEKNPKNGEGVAAVQLGGGEPNAPKTDEEKLKAYETQAKRTNDGIGVEFAMEKADLQARAGHKDDALATLKALMTTDMDKGMTHELEMKSTQIGLNGSAAPELTFDRTIGSYKNLDSLKGKVVVLDFFAHWCGPCMMSIPSMEALYKEMHPKGMEIVGVTGYYGFFGANRGITPDVEFSKLQGLIKEKKMPWPIAVGPKTNSSEYGVYGIPQVVIIDKKGVIRDIRVGYDEGGEKALHDEIAKLINE